MGDLYTHMELSNKHIKKKKKKKRMPSKVYINIDCMYIAYLQSARFTLENCLSMDTSSLQT